MIGVVFVTGVAAYLLIQADDTSQSGNSKTNSTTGNQTENNTNIIKNINTKGWQSYVDSNYKYSIQYPSSYTMLGEGELVRFISNEVSSENLDGVIILLHTRNDSDVSRWARAGFSGPLPAGYSNVRTVTIGDNSFTAADEVGEKGTITRYFIIRNAIVYEISESFPRKEKSDSISIISTFVFIN